MVKHLVVFNLVHCCASIECAVQRDTTVRTISTTSIDGRPNSLTATSSSDHAQTATAQATVTKRGYGKALPASHLPFQTRWILGFWKGSLINSCFVAHVVRVGDATWLRVGDVKNFGVDWFTRCGCTALNLIISSCTSFQPA